MSTPRIEQTGENRLGVYYAIERAIPVVHYPQHGRILCLRCVENTCVHARALATYLGLSWSDVARPKTPEVVELAAPMGPETGLDCPEQPLGSIKPPKTRKSSKPRKRAA